MADTGWLVKTGEGHQLIDGGASHTVFDMWAVIDAIGASKTRILGTDVPRRIQFAGSCGWGQMLPDRHGVTQLFILWEMHISFEVMLRSAQALQGGNTLDADTIWWKLPPGVTVALLGSW